MKVDLLELASSLLGALVEEVIFVGGATIDLWITDPSAPEPRPTDDVDVIVDVTTRGDYYAFAERLRAAGFQEDQASEVICRFKHSESGLRLDAMPLGPKVLGFSSEWHREAAPHAVERALPSGDTIRAIPPPYLLATKLEAFASRGRGDFFGSRDFADIVSLLDGREELVAEVRQAAPELRRYLARQLSVLAADPRFREGISGALLPDAASQARAELVVLPRIAKLIEGGGN